MITLTGSLLFIIDGVVKKGIKMNSLKHQKFLLVLHLSCCLLMTIFFKSCDKNTPILQENEEEVLLPENTVSNTIRFLALGDSYTVGEGVETRESWPYQLVDSITKEFQLDTEIEIIAETGYSTSELKQAYERAAIDKRYDLISIQIGVNDQFRGYNPEEFRDQFIEFLNIILSNPKVLRSSIVIVSIPDWGSTPFGRNWDREKVFREIDQFNTILRGISHSNQIMFINITDISRISPNDWSLVAQDGLHPSGKMYSLWVGRLIPSIAYLLNYN